VFSSNVSFDEFRVLNRRVDAGTGVLYFGDKYIETIFDGTQLFEFFEFFQRRLRQLCNLQQENLSDKHIFRYDANNSLLHLSRPADGRMVLRNGEVYRDTRCLMLDARYYNFYDIRVGDLLFGLEVGCQCCHLAFGVINKKLGNSVNICRFDFGFVAL